MAHQRALGFSATVRGRQAGGQHSTLWQPARIGLHHRAGLHRGGKRRFSGCTGGQSGNLRVPNPVPRVLKRRSDFCVGDAQPRPPPLPKLVCFRLSGGSAISPENRTSAPGLCGPWVSRRRAIVPTRKSLPRHPMRCSPSTACAASIASRTHADPLPVRLGAQNAPISQAMDQPGTQLPRPRMVQAQTVG